MVWSDLLSFILEVWEGILVLVDNVREFLSYETSILGYEINVFSILFGVGFSAWVIFKAIT